MSRDGESDAALLERFARKRDEAAFGTLVERHGPMVLRACRRVLRHEQDVEDVYQATFLVLAHKAGVIRWDASVGGWLHAAARRLALHARSRSGSRRVRERPLSTVLKEAEHPWVDPQGEIEGHDLRRAVGRAVDQLPEKYRAPVVLCYLQGKTHEEAARQLGWPAGSMSRRLQRARSLLRHKLASSALVGAIALAATTFPLLARRDRLAPAGWHGTLRVRLAAVPHEDSTTGISPLAELVRAPLSPEDREQVARFARNSERAAWALAERVADPPRGIWLYESARMRQAAGDLAAALARDDRPAVLAAARRLDSSCVGCHEVFRQ